jgi:hypothetical protein
MGVQLLPYDPADDRDFPEPEPRVWAGPFLVVQAHYIGGDNVHNKWLLDAAEWSEREPGPGWGRELDAWDGFVRPIGGEVRVLRHYAMEYAAFWDAMGAALPALGVAPDPAHPGWRDNGHHGFYMYVKEVKA